MTKDSLISIISFSFPNSKTLSNGLLPTTIWNPKLCQQNAAAKNFSKVSFVQLLATYLVYFSLTNLQHKFKNTGKRDINQKILGGFYA